MKLTRRGEALVYLTALALGFLSVPLGVWWT
jgi:hypothetical protein